MHRLQHTFGEILVGLGVATILGNSVGVLGGCHFVSVLVAVGNSGNGVAVNLTRLVGFMYSVGVVSATPCSPPLIAVPIVQVKINKNAITTHTILFLDILNPP